MSVQQCVTAEMYRGKKIVKIQTACELTVSPY